MAHSGYAIWWTGSDVLSSRVGGQARMGLLAGPGCVREPYAMSRLLAIIDEYRDAHGQPSDASIARAIGIKPQTLSSWRKRGFKVPPDNRALHELARLTNLDYRTVVLQAALYDAGWLEEDEGHGDASSIAN